MRQKKKFPDKLAELIIKYNNIYLFSFLSTQPDEDRQIILNKFSPAA